MQPTPVDTDALMKNAAEYFRTDNWDKMWKAAIVLEDKNAVQFSDLEMDTSLFPYYADGPFNPPLPTMQDILAAKKIARAAQDPNRLYGAAPNRQVVRVGPYFVKYGTSPDIFQEAENILYLERNSSVRVPKLYAAFASNEVDQWEMFMVKPTLKPGEKLVGPPPPEYVYEEREFFYLIEEYIEGVEPEDVYPDAHASGRKKIEELLWDQISKLRSVPAEDPKHFGRIAGRKFPKRFPMLYRPPAPSYDDFGPFDYETFVERLQHSSIINYALSHPILDLGTKLKYDTAKVAFLDNVRPDERQPILSHLDLDSRNIIVKGAVYDGNRVVDVEEVAIIDWEFLCWVPNWIEPATMLQKYIQHDTPEPCRELWMEVLPAMIHTSWTTAMWFAFCLQGCEYVVF